MVGPSLTIEVLGWRLAAAARDEGLSDLSVRIRDGKLESIDAWSGDQREFYTLVGDSWMKLVKAE